MTFLSCDLVLLSFFFLVRASWSFGGIDYFFVARGKNK